MRILRFRRVFLALALGMGFFYPAHANISQSANVSAAAGNVVFEVTAPSVGGSYGYSNLSFSQTWLSKANIPFPVSMNNSYFKITLAVTANTGAARTATCSCTLNGNPTILTVYQAGGTPAPVPYTITKSVSVDAQRVVCSDSRLQEVFEFSEPSVNWVTDWYWSGDDIVLTIDENTGSKRSVTLSLYDCCSAQAVGTLTLTQAACTSCTTPDPGLCTVWFCAGAHGKRTGGGDMKQAISYGGYATAPTIQAYPGWRFIGWDKSTGPIYDNTAITAQYVAGNCGVTFDAGSKGRHVGGGNMKQTIPFGGRVTNPPGIKANTGYKFLGWDGNLNLITRSVTMTAQYDVGAYTATFVIDSSKGRHVGGGNMKQTVAYKNSPAPPGVRAKAGYVFKGWSPAISGMTRNQTYTAVFQAQ